MLSYPSVKTRYHLQETGKGKGWGRSASREPAPPINKEGQKEKINSNRLDLENQVGQMSAAQGG